MKVKSSMVGLLSAAGFVIGSAGTVAQAVEFDSHTWGPIELNGYVEVDNTGVGGGVPNFACKIVGYGRIDPNYPTTGSGANKLWIDGLQARHRASGDAPEGCNFVRFYNLPWEVVFTGTDPDAPTVVINNVGFQMPPLPGCGMDSGGVTVSNGLVWSNGGPHVPTGGLGPAGDGVYSTLGFTNSIVRDGNGDCVIMKGIVKITRPHAPVLVD